MTQRTWTGLATMGLAIAFNIPYAVLASIFEYPEVLRYSAASALTRFAEGGTQLILAWFGFMLAALAFVPLGTALSVTADRLAKRPALAIGAAIAAGLSGLAQAIGLSRWVFVVPALARRHADPDTSSEGRRAAERAFEILNSYGGVGIGEYLGQWLLALFVIQVASMQWQEGARGSALLGLATAALIAVGTNEGLAITLGGTGAGFSMATIAGFLALTGWLLTTAIGLLRAPRAA